MNTFYTITDSVTSHTNSRSKRFYSYEEAKIAAIERINSGMFNSSSGVIVLKAIKIITPVKCPIVEQELE